jgi:hypothetical protein
VGALRRLFLVAILLVAGVATPAPADSSVPVVEALSNRPDLISGGDVLVAVTVAHGILESFRAGASEVRLERVGPGRWSGLVTGLPVGPTTLTARSSADTTGRLVVTNHPSTGPVLAGRQVQPWVCHTDLTGLGPARDKACSTPSRVTWSYKDAVTGGFADYDPAAPPPAYRVSRTTTDQGVTVPYVVRVENGVLDRGLFTIAVLGDPTKPWTALHPQLAWNHKLGSPFGGSCNPRHQQEAVDTGANAMQPTLFSVLDDAKLSRGFMVAHSAMGNLGSNCNEVVAAESLMMLEEHIREELGSIRWTIGYGCSGGSMLQHLIAADYPGLLDGITPACSFPDIWSTLLESEDCHLLERVFAADPSFTAAQQAAITGYQTPASCLTFDKLVVNNTSQWFDPAQTANCGAAMPAGLRCDIADYQVALLGRRPDGKANRPYDNSGVVYGLQAYLAHLVTADQLVSLNEQVGGDDIDWHHTTGRSHAEPAGVRRAYAGGRILDGHLLAAVPILDLRGTSNQEIHTDYHSYVVRARLDEANGDHGNQVIWSSVPLTVDPVSYAQSFFVMDDWLSRIAADHRPISRPRKVVLDKPPVAVDSCWVAGRQVTDLTACGAVFPHYGDPRIAAGGTLAGGNLLCALKPLSVPGLTASQAARLLRVFPQGSCDSSRPSREWSRARPWATY